MASPKKKASSSKQLQPVGKTRGKRGRARDPRNVYTPEKGALICRLIADHERPRTLTEVLQMGNVDLPNHHSAIYRWRKEHPEFGRALDMARERYCELREEQNTNLVDDLVASSATVASKADAFRVDALVKSLRLKMYHDREYAKVHYRSKYGDKVEVHNKGFVPIVSAPMGSPPPGADPEDAKRFAGQVIDDEADNGE